MLIFFVAEDPFGANDILALGGGSKTHISLRVKLFNSSCIANNQSRSLRASSTHMGSTKETNEYVQQIKLAV
jgi:hypothetical protein